VPKGVPHNRGKDVSMGPALPQPTSRVRPNENNVNLAVLNTTQNLGSAIQEGITMPKRNLPVFDGDPLQYFGFMKRFEEIVLKQVAEPALQLEYLINMCVGEAAEAVRSCIVISPASAALQTVLNRLASNFGRKHVMVQAHLVGIIKGPLHQV